MQRKPEFDVVTVRTLSVDGVPGEVFRLEDPEIQAIQLSNPGIIIEWKDGRSAFLIPWPRVLNCDLKELSVKIR